MNKTFQWNGEKFYFSALEAETTRKFIPEATKTAKALEDYEKDVVGVGNLLSADDIIAECKIIDAFLDTILGEGPGRTCSGNAEADTFKQRTG